MFEGLAKGYQGSLLPILSTNLTLYDAVRRLDHLTGAVLPTSTRKIQHCKVGSMKSVIVVFRSPVDFRVECIQWCKQLSFVTR
jgi:BioD-like phosphotransacetylase family protein